MRKILTALSAVAFTVSIAAVSVGQVEAAKAPAKSKMGCVVGKEKWNAVDGKCVAAAPVKKAVKKA